MVRKIVREVSDTRCISLRFREENWVAGLFAKFAHNLSSRVDFYREEDIPMYVRKCIFLDKIGIPTFRSPCNWGSLFPYWSVRFFNEAPTLVD